MGDCAKYGAVYVRNRMYVLRTWSLDGWTDDFGRDDEKFPTVLLVNVADACGI